MTLRSPAPRETAPVTDALTMVGRGHIAFAHFSVWYDARQALYDVNLDIEPNAITALIGPSGCGKTTALRAINRLNDLIPDSRHDGQLRLGGADVYATGVDTSLLRQQVGMVFQRPNPFPRTIFENVAYGARLNELARGTALDQVVERSLRRAALWDEVKDRLRESALSLSLGQQQRLCIARALANEPDVLLLDEPAGALDPVGTQHIEELLVELRRELTIVMVTHNLQQAARVSDRAAFLYEGALVEVDITSRLFTKPRDARTEAYITGRFG